MVFYDTNKSISIKNKIIDIDSLIDIYNYYYNLFNDFENKFKESEQANEGVSFENQFYEYYKIDNRFEFTLKRTDGFEQSFSEKQYDYVVDELRRNIELYQDVKFSFSVQYYDDYKNIEKDYCSYNADIKLWFSNFEDNNDDLEIIIYLENADHIFRNNHEFIVNLDARLPEKTDFIIKHRYLIQEVCSLAIGFIISTLLLLVLFIVKDQIQVIYYSQNTFALFQLALTFILGNIFVYLYIGSIYRIIYYTKYENMPVTKYYKDVFESTNEFHFGAVGKKKEKARNKISTLYNISKKALLIELGVFVIMYVIMIFVL